MIYKHKHRIFHSRKLNEQCIQDTSVTRSPGRVHCSLATRRLRALQESVVRVTVISLLFCLCLASRLLCISFRVIIHAELDPWAARQELVKVGLSVVSLARG